MREQRREVGCSWVRGGGGGAGGPRAQGGGPDAGCVCGSEMGGQRTEAARRAPGPGPSLRSARPWDLCWGGGKCQRATAGYAQRRAEVRDTCYANAHQGSGRPIETCAEDPTLAYVLIGWGRRRSGRAEWHSRGERRARQQAHAFRAPGCLNASFRRSCLSGRWGDNWRTLAIIPFADRISNETQKK